MHCKNLTGLHVTVSRRHGPPLRHQTSAANGPRSGQSKPTPQKTMASFLFDDDECLSAGEGITRTTNPKACLWSFEARLEQMRPLRGTIRATNKSEARRFAEARHPNAVKITIHGKANHG
jgi:hypothetical protein